MMIDRIVFIHSCKNRENLSLPLELDNQSIDGGLCRIVYGLVVFQVVTVYIHVYIYIGLPVSSAPTSG